MIYLDHNATAPVLSEVVEAMLPWLRENWGNPSSIHAPGRLARRAIEDARGKVAALIDAEPNQVIFTSSATEANNAALHSAVFRQPGKRHVITSVVEHSAVLAYCDYLEKHHGVKVTRLPVDSEGMLDPHDLRQAIRSETAVVSLMWANNETGVIWPISEFAAICSEAGVPLHTDTVQAVGKIPVSFRDSSVEFLTLSGHKFGAPKGIGALIVRDPDSFVPLLYGGKQEGALRGGTENVPHIVALGKAAEIAASRDRATWRKVADLRNRFERTMLEEIRCSEIHAAKSPRLPNTSCLHLPGLDGDCAVTYLDQQGICVSSGSACLESAITPSHVLQAMTGSYEMADESIRVSLGLETTEDDLLQLVKALQAFTVQVP
ncbi:cysteine desulfurase family protein [Haloferula sargassicola]|uniref:Cysteine desulfurase NifS n=1 Tax=Haloferula sargassicola TaxID=490096 RepID=A0ABP9UIC6_9BACT